MNTLKKRSTAKKRGRRAPLGRDAWLTCARTALVCEGIGGVEIGKLARKLRATRGGFYWFFKSRDELLDQLLTDWEERNSAALKRLADDPVMEGVAAFQALCDIWITEHDYSPQWDAAVREWARISTRTERVVRRVDDARIAMIQQFFAQMGYDSDEAFVRARTTYFHQVGYYTLGVHETAAERRRLLPLYVRILTGR